MTKTNSNSKLQENHNVIYETFLAPFISQSLGRPAFWRGYEQGLSTTLKVLPELERGKSCARRRLPVCVAALRPLCLWRRA